MHTSAGTLFVVATPIGNLEDITYRAVRVLSSCDYILCEDTRVTGKLKERYGIETPLRHYDAHASTLTHARVLEDLTSGKRLALVSDAGTPGVSDPGVLLVARARQAGVRIDAVPGPSAVTAAFSIAGISGNQFAFLGFAPHKKGRATFFRDMATRTEPVIFFESTHRIMKTLDSLKEQCIATNRRAQVYLGRELTKLHEEMIVGSPDEVIAQLESEVVRQKGEFVLIVEYVT